MPQYATFVWFSNPECLQSPLILKKKCDIDMVMGLETARLCQPVEHIGDKDRERERESEACLRPLFLVFLGHRDVCSLCYLTVVDYV